MYRQDYADIVADDHIDARRREFDAVNHVVTLLERAAQSSARGRQYTEALDGLDALWTVFLDDLAKDDNALPTDVRARLISIGLWMFRRTCALRIGGGDLSSLIEINSIVRDSLR